MRMTLPISLMLLLPFLCLEDSAAADPAYPQVQEFNNWPHVMLSAGMLYAPAPLVREREAGRQDKLLDELGWQLALDFHAFEYLTFGGQFTGLYATRGGSEEGSSLLEAGFRLGAFFPLGDRWAIRAVVIGGISGLRSNDPDRVSSYNRRYWGVQAWAIAGLVYRISPDLVFYADISGTATRYDATTWISVHSPQIDPYDYPNLFRLQFGVGIAICWEKVRWGPPPRARIQ